MKPVFICDAIRTPVGKFGGSLSTIRVDDLAAIPIRALMDRQPDIDWEDVDDVLLGCANQAGEDNRNVSRMALLLAGMSETIPGATINRLCGSGMDAIGTAARAIRAGEADFIIAGGVESMSRSPWVMPKPEQAFSRTPDVYDTTIGWRFVNKHMKAMGHTESLIQTAETIASEMNISREDQDEFAFWSQTKAKIAQESGALGQEIVSVRIPRRKQDDLVFEHDEHLRLTPLDKLATLNPVLGEGTTITAGNASGINDGAAALLIASEEAVKKHNLEPKVRVLGMKVAGVPPRTMGMGPVPATRSLMSHLGLSLDELDIIELNEAFAAQSLGCTRELGLDDNDPRINPLGGAIALGHPLGMSGARLVTTASYQLMNSSKKFALCTMCIGVGQGIATVLEKV